MACILPHNLQALYPWSNTLDLNPAMQQMYGALARLLDRGSCLPAFLQVSKRPDPEQHCIAVLATLQLLTTWLLPLLMLCWCEESETLYLHSMMTSQCQMPGLLQFRNCSL